MRKRNSFLKNYPALAVLLACILVFALSTYVAIHSVISLVADLPNGQYKVACYVTMFGVLIATVLGTISGFHRFCNHGMSQEKWEQK